MVDSRIQYTHECIEYIFDQSVTYKLSGGLHGSIRWSFETQNELTQVSLVLEYEAPAPLLKHHSESEIVRRNEHSVQQALCNLKTVLEKQSLLQK
jgi:hypothetical protein